MYTTVRRYVVFLMKYRYSGHLVFIDYTGVDWSLTHSAVRHLHSPRAHLFLKTIIKDDSWTVNMKLSNSN